MITRFFTNAGKNTLLKKFAGVFAHNARVFRLNGLTQEEIALVQGNSGGSH